MDEEGLFCQYDSTVFTVNLISLSPQLSSPAGCRKPLHVEPPQPPLIAALLSHTTRTITQRTFKTEKEFFEFTLSYQKVLLERDADSDSAIAAEFYPALPPFYLHLRPLRVCAGGLQPFSQHGGSIIDLRRCSKVIAIANSNPDMQLDSMTSSANQKVITVRKKLAFKLVLQMALDLARGSRTVKIADFGVVCVESSNPNNITGETGTLGHMALEVLNANPYNRKCNAYRFGILRLS
ncbi:hypothetical protein L2E82_12696 [Cichorium intybus]|uniref:Uncharacterized protein n=1 Tax=Cichorium intybus TaxID=13427 RepID=A0ACB9GHX4_CICIN|nr:hypothetical protein L2E82_12696 [Cichorium intybus]